MKKTKHFKQILLLAAAMFGLVASAQTPDGPVFFNATCSTGHVLRYKVTSPNTVTIVSCVSGGALDLDIPAEVENDGIMYRVNVIKTGAFSYKTLFSVSIPWSIDTIHISAFDGFHLRDVNFNARDCHMGCDSVSNAWGDPVTTHWRNINIGDSVVRVCDSAFTTSSIIGRIVIGESVTHIGHTAFTHDYIDTLISHALEAPALDDSVTVYSPYLDSVVTVYSPPFPPSCGSTHMLVPCGSLESYRQGWTMFKTIYENADYYDVTVSNDGFGEAYVLEKFCEDQKVVVKAEAYYGYMFSNWNDGNTDNPRTLYLTQDTVLTAHFTPTATFENGETAVSVHPNPTEGLFTIGAEDITAVEVFDQLGQKVMTDHSGSRTVNVSALPAGIYFLKVETATGTKYGKLMRR